jgi:uracil-DNA glycosylase family 4
MTLLQALETHPGLTTLALVYEDHVEGCQRCGRARTRKHLIYGSGATEKPRIAFVAETPGLLDDRRGRAFVGEEGELLRKGIAALDLSPDTDTYSCFLTSCRSGSRAPTSEEISACSPVLDSQLLAIMPQTIYAFGERVAHALLGSEKEPLERLRGRWHTWGHPKHPCPLRVTYHPKDVLEDRTLARPFWDDLWQVTLLEKHESC